MRQLWLVLFGLVIVGSGWAQSPFDLEIQNAQLPAFFEPGVDRHVEVTLVNRGVRPWEPEHGFFVSAHWYRADGEQWIWDGPRTPLPGPVQPNESVNIEVLVTTPAEVGPAALQFDVVQEGVLWVTRRSGRPVETMPVVIARSYAFAFLETGTPMWAAARNRQQVPLRLRNDGMVSWTADGSFAVAAHWRRVEGDEVVWEGLRTHFPREVPSGATVTVLAAVQAPDDVGRWLLEWDIVHEGVCWFSERATEGTRSDVVVVLPACAPAWPAVGLTLAMALVVVGLSRGWWGKPQYARDLDLVWMVATPWLAERTVVEIGFCGGLVSLLCLAFLASVVALLPRSLRPVSVWFGGSAMMALVVADRVYLRFFQDLPSLGSVSGFGQVDRLGESVLSLVEVSDIAHLGAALLGAAVCLPVGRMRCQPAPFKKRLAVAVITLVCMLSALAMVARTATVRQVFRRAFVAREAGVIGAHFVDVGGWVTQRLTARGLAPSELERIERWFRDRTVGSATGDGLFGVAKDLNLLMIQAESLQAFVPGLSVAGQDVTPTLNRWLRESIVFDRVTDQTGHGRSSDAELLTQVSLLPLTDGAAAFAAAGNRYTSLAGELAGRGYHTLSAVPFDRTFWNRNLTHRAYGFSDSLFVEDFSPGEAVGWGLGDREFFNQMGSRLADMPQPFCVWLITLSLHHPFDGFPERLEEMDVGRWQGSPVGAYLHTMRYFDRALADLEERLRSSGLMDSTVIVIWGDHDAGFEWTPEVAALMGVRPDKVGWYVSQRVPLIIRLPANLHRVETYGKPAGHIDVAPTLAALFGIDPGPMAWMGRNLLAKTGDEPVIGEYDCWMDSRHVFLQGDGTLDGGICLDGADLQPRPVSACAAAFEEAAERVDIAQLILRHDLQAALTAGLSADGS